MMSASASTVPPVMWRRSNAGTGAPAATRSINAARNPWTAAWPERHASSFRSWHVPSSARKAQVALVLSEVDVHLGEAGHAARRQGLGKGKQRIL